MNSFIYENSWVVMVVATFSLRQLKNSIFQHFLIKYQLLLDKVICKFLTIIKKRSLVIGYCSSKKI